MADLQKAFKVLDLNGDGMLNQSELAAGYKNLYGNKAEKVAAQVFKRIDMDNSGQIDYSEFVVATINKRKLLTDDKIRQAFNLFDKDGGGMLSPDEIKDILFPGQKFESDVWQKVIDEVDDDGNGEISLDEFALMMKSMLKTGKETGESENSSQDKSEGGED